MDLGACKYCGNYIVGQYKEDMTEKQRGEVATSICKCEKAEEERHRTNERIRAKERIKMLLVEESERLGFKSTVEDREIITLLEVIVDMTSDSKINKVSMSLEDDTKIRITEKDGKISVERMQSIKYKL